MTRPPEDMDAALRRVRVEPRASLEPEIAGRFAAGERARRGAARRAGTTRRLWVGAAVAAVVAVGAVASRGGYVAPLDGLAATATVDRCCDDLDGGGRPDDGVVVESVRGQRVRRLMVYEEHDNDRTWSPGELVRFARRGAPTLRPRGAGGAMVTRAFCCSDYDGGGSPDDGLLVVATATGDVLMAALFERGNSSDHFVLR
jgi:hypothetical protein